MPVMHRAAELVGDAGLVQQFPEAVARVRVGVAGRGRGDAWVEADKDAN